MPVLSIRVSAPEHTALTAVAKNKNMSINTLVNLIVTKIILSDPKGKKILESEELKESMNRKSDNNKE